MDIFIPEDYVKTRREIRKQQKQKQRPGQQKQKLQIQISQLGSPDGSPLPTPRDSPSGLAFVTAAAASPVAAFASAATRISKASAEGRAFSTDRLFDCFKPY